MEYRQNETELREQPKPRFEKHLFQSFKTDTGKKRNREPDPQVYCQEDTTGSRETLFFKATQRVSYPNQITTIANSIPKEKSLDLAEVSSKKAELSISQNYVIGLIFC